MNTGNPISILLLGFCTQAVSGFEMTGHWIIISSPKMETGVAQDANEKVIRIVGISSQMLVFQTNYHPDSPNSSIYDAVKSGMGGGDEHETFFVATLFDYVSTQSTIGHFKVDFGSQTIRREGSSPSFINVESL